MNVIANERQLVAGLIHHPSVIANKQIMVEHFTDGWSASVLGAMLAILSEGNTPDPVSTNERMGSAGDLGKLLGDWKETKPANRDTVSNWADGIKKAHRQRALLEALSDATRAAKANKSPEEVIALVLKKIGTLNASGEAYSKSIKQVLSGFVDTLDQRSANEGQLLGIPSGLNDLDSLLLGFRPSSFYVVGARPSMGKTALMGQSALNAASRGHAVGIISAEMTSEQLVERMVATTGRIDAHQLGTGKLDDDGWPRLNAAVTTLSDNRLMFFDKPSCTIADITLQAREWSLSGGLDILFVDYLSLLKPEGKHETRSREVGDMAQALKQLARTLKIPVVCLAQLSRKCDDRPNKRPINADLRDSGEIEQEADAILFLYRDEVYHPDTDSKGVAEIIVRKNRHGNIATVKALWLGQYQRFENFTGDMPWA